MNSGIFKGALAVLTLAMIIMATTTAGAADLYWDGGTANIGGDGDGASAGGAGTWDTTIQNWDQGVSAHVAWPDTDADKAIFGGTAGEVDLGSDITLNQMQVEVRNYKIGDSVNEANILNFGGTTPQITLNSAAIYTYIYAGVTGSPNLNVGLPDKNHSYLVPNVESMTLGHVTYTRMGSRLHLGGTTSGNSIASFSAPSYATIIADGSGTWTLGNISGPGQVELYQNSGNLIANGTIDISAYFRIQGGVFHYNNAAAVAASKLDFCHFTTAENRLFYRLCQNSRRVFPRQLFRRVCKKCRHTYFPRVSQCRAVTESAKVELRG